MCLKIDNNHIKLMISLKLQHSHHLPCHPTRRYLENQASINETDREHQTDQSEEDNNYEFKTIQHRPGKREFDQTNNQNQTVNQGDQPKLKKKKSKKKIKNATSQDVYNASLLDKSFTASTNNLPINIRMLVMQHQKLVEDKVYIGITSQNNNGNTILGRIYEEDANANNVQIKVKQELFQMMKDIHKGISTDITETDQYYIHKIVRSKKEDILSNKKGRLVSNYSSTGMSFPNRASSETDNMTTNSQPVTKGDFSLASQDTKKAENFIKKIQVEQQELRKKNKQMLEQKKNLQVRSVQEKKQFEEEIKQQRRNYLKRRFEAKKQMRQKQMQVREKMNKEYKQFLAKYKKKTPLFMKKEQEHIINQSIEDEKLKNYISEKRKEQMKPVRIEELKQHQRKYNEFKMQKQSMKENQKKLKLQEIHKNRPHITYRKSKYFQILQQEEQKQKERKAKEDPKLIRSDLIKKRDVYAKSVRENYLPKTSPIKHKELQKQIQKLKWSEQLRNKKKSDRQYIDQGDQNLKDLHRQIAQLREQGKIPDHQNQTIDFTPSPKPIYKNYLEQLRYSSIKARNAQKNDSRHSHRKRYSSIDVIDRTTNKLDFQGLNNLARQKQLKANRRYLYASSNNDVGKNLKQMGEADQYYLDAVKAKIELLNRLE